MQNTLLKIKESRWTSRLLSPLILLMLIVIFGAATGGRFSSVQNLKMVVEQALIVGTVATGAVFIFSTGNVNISMGAATALIATISAQQFVKTGSIALLFLVAVSSGMLTLALTALLSTLLKVRVLYITVVMMTLLSSIQQVILGPTTISVPSEMLAPLKNINALYITFIAFFLFCTVLFHFTALGRKLRYIGINDVCADLTGFKKGKYLFIAFLVAGIGVGLGAVCAIIRSGTVTKDTCAGLNMDCMLAIVLGGMSCFGGNRSNTYSAITGSVMVTMLNNGLLMVGVSSTILQAIRGIIFIILVCISQTRPQGLPSRDG